MADSRVRKAAGTYGARDTIRGKSASSVIRGFLLLRDFHPELPGHAASQADIDAVRNGESRIVSCFLRGPSKPYPRRLTYGYLRISSKSMTWKPALRLPWRHTLQIDIRVLAVQAREPGWRELDHVPGGQKLRDGVMVPKWTVVSARQSAGSVEFLVPTPDVALVTGFLTGGSTEAVNWVLAPTACSRSKDYDRDSPQTLAVNGFDGMVRLPS